MMAEEGTLLTADEVYDVKIVGMRSAGYAAAVQAMWASLSTVVLSNDTLCLAAFLCVVFLIHSSAVIERAAVE